MPEAVKTDIEVAQRAMLLVGLQPLTSFTDNTAEAEVVNGIYEDLVEDCLSQSAWNFATGQQQLSRLVTATTDRYDASYAMPTIFKVLQALAVTINGDPQNYDIYNTSITLDASETDDVILSYIFRVPTENWPPFFTLWVVYRLASVIALSVTRNDDVIQPLLQLAEQQLRVAKTRDSQQVTNKGFILNRFKSVRRF